MRVLLVATFLLFTAVAQTGQAETIRLTLYSDGLSCPSNCDAHVVFSNELNGTQYAHQPGTQYNKCVRDEQCRICIQSGERQCIQTIYRGVGPGKMTFDFTPAFYQDACAGNPAQPAMATKCIELKNAAKRLEGRVNCITTPNEAPCIDIIARAKAAHELDLPKLQQCRAMGQDIYNRGNPPTEKRRNNCTYEYKGTGGPNSRGTTWRKLLPAACRAGTYRGRDGLDCCAGDTIEDGPMGLECIGFYPKP